MKETVPRNIAANLGMARAFKRLNISRTDTSTKIVTMLAWTASQAFQPSSTFLKALNDKFSLQYSFFSVFLHGIFATILNIRYIYTAQVLPLMSSFFFCDDIMSGEKRGVVTSDLGSKTGNGYVS